MKISNINNNTQSFKGILRLTIGAELRGPGFPKCPDCIDVFEYHPY